MQISPESRLRGDSIQLCDALAAIAYSGGFTFFILMAMELVVNLFRGRPGTETDFAVVVDADDILDTELQAERILSASGGATGAATGEPPEATGAVNPEGATELHPLPRPWIHRARGAAPPMEVPPPALPALN